MYSRQTELIFQTKFQTRSFMPTSSIQYVKSVRIRGFSGPYFPAFGQNTDQKYGSEKFQIYKLFTLSRLFSSLKQILLIEEESY